MWPDLRRARRYIGLSLSVLFASVLEGERERERSRARERYMIKKKIHALIGRHGRPCESQISVWFVSYFPVTLGFVTGLSVRIRGSKSNVFQVWCISCSVIRVSVTEMLKKCCKGKIKSNVEKCSRWSESGCIYKEINAGKKRCMGHTWQLGVPLVDWN